MPMPLTADQGRDSICIDFEGLTDHAPVLIGIEDPLAVGTTTTPHHMW